MITLIILSSSLFFGFFWEDSSKLAVVVFSTISFVTYSTKYFTLSKQWSSSFISPIILVVLEGKGHIAEVLVGFYIHPKPPWTLVCLALDNGIQLWLSLIVVWLRLPRKCPPKPLHQARKFDLVPHCCLPVQLPNSRSNQFKTMDSKDLERLYNCLVVCSSVCLFGRHALLMRFSRLPLTSQSRQVQSRLPLHPGRPS